MAVVVNALFSFRLQISFLSEHTITHKQCIHIIPLPTAAAAEGALVVEDPVAMASPRNQVPSC